MEKIASLRSRYERLSSSLLDLEARVAKQASQLDRMNRPRGFEDEDDDDGGNEVDPGDDTQVYVSTTVSDEEVVPVDIQQEAEEIKELERKKRVLEDRVGGMEKDLGGLLR